MTDDVVAELDRWRTTPRTAENAHEFVPIGELLQRARDDVVALRSIAKQRLSMVQDANRCIEETQALLVAVRNEALEEAARIAENECIVPPDAEEEQEMCYHIAAAIRALKGKRDG